MEIRLDKLICQQVIALIREHLHSMAPTAPAESRHALDLDGLRGPDITFWSIWDGKELAGIGALKHLSPAHAEIKSMRTAAPYLRKGIASRMLNHIIFEAEQCGYGQLSLETGSMAFFEPARKLYSAFGFTKCGPFGSYSSDPNSVFMTRSIGAPGGNGIGQHHARGSSRPGELKF
ncbi:MAG: GNAT family N-acetyltransferase [Haliea sp.]|uniref:GNAT family N-acetyltransferase n=1 Tax=Haliea sp. TaxID=1932666 RepID=UPI0032EE5718